MKKWTDYLSEDVYSRLCNCQTRKSDLPNLVNAKWSSLIDAGKDKAGFTKEDALIAVLELLDCNSCCFDLTAEEYNNLRC